MNPYVKFSLQSILKLLQTIRHFGTHTLRTPVRLHRTIGHPLVQVPGTGTISAPTSLSPLAKHRAGTGHCLRGPQAACVTSTETDSSPNSHSYAFFVSDIHLLPFKLNLYKALYRQKKQHTWKVRREGNVPISSIRAQKAVYSSEGTRKTVSRSRCQLLCQFGTHHLFNTTQHLKLRELTEISSISTSTPPSAASLSCLLVSTEFARRTILITSQTKPGKK